MCLIAEQIKSVKNTKILCALNADKSRQIVVYANEINNISNNNAMILPVLNPQSLKFHDLSNYVNIFDDCAKGFYNITNEDTYRSKSSDCANQTLKVFDVGSYSVSVALTIDELKLVDSTVFTLSKDFEGTLRSVYKNSAFGYIICALKSGEKLYHPLAYSNDVYESKVFAPTLHYHVHDGKPGFGPIGDWSHEIYLYNIVANDIFTKMNISKKMWHETATCMIDPVKLDFNLGPLESYTQLCIVGEHRNVDLICRV